MINASDLLPLWYIHEDTPAGPRWYYPAGDILTGPDAVTALASDQPGRVTLDTARGLVIADHKLNTVTWTGTPTRHTTGWTLRDPSSASERFPTHITPDQFHALSRQDDDLVWRLYQPVTEDRPGSQTIVDFSHHQLLTGGGLDEHTQYRWYNGLGHQIHAPFGHLRPGHLAGVWDLLADALRPLPHVRSVSTSGNEITVYLSLPWDEPQTWWRDRYGARGQRLQRQEQVVSTHVDKHLALRPPRAIAAPNKAAAVTELRRLTAELVDQVMSMQVVACSSCKGHGYTIPDSAGETS